MEVQSWRISICKQVFQIYYWSLSCRRGSCCGRGTKGWLVKGKLLPEKRPQVNGGRPLWCRCRRRGRRRHKTHSEEGVGCHRFYSGERDGRNRSYLPGWRCRCYSTHHLDLRLIGAKYGWLRCVYSPRIEPLRRSCCIGQGLEASGVPRGYGGGRTVLVEVIHFQGPLLGYGKLGVFQRLNLALEEHGQILERVNRVARQDLQRVKRQSLAASSSWVGVASQGCQGQWVGLAQLCSGCRRGWV